MGQIFTLDSNIKGIIQQALDDIITELDKPCRLYYPSRWVSCDNCTLNPAGNISSNRYRHGGPVPFPSGSACPLCSGQGKRAEEQTEDINLLCSADPKKFFVPIPNLPIQVPDGILQTKGYMTDLPKILRAEFMLYQTSIDGYQKRKYRLLSEPVDSSNIIQNRYFVATWERMKA